MFSYKLLQISTFEIKVNNLYKKHYLVQHGDLVMI